MSEPGPLDPYVARELRARVDDGDVAWLRLQHRAGRLEGLRELLAPDDWAELGARVDAGDVVWARRVLGDVRLDARSADVAWSAAPALPAARPPRERARLGAFFATGAVIAALALVALGLSQCRGAGTTASDTTATPTTAAAAAAASSNAEPATTNTTSATTVVPAATTTAAAATATAPATTTSTTSAAGTTTSSPAGAATATTAAPAQNVIGTATAAGLTTFVRAITTGDLTSILGATGPFTLLAPSEAAFAKLPAATLEGLLKDRVALVRALRYHVLPGRLTAAQLTAGTVRTLEGNTVRVAVADGQTTVNDALVTRTDLAATNGLVHVIDTMLIPPLFSVGGAPVTAAPRPTGDVVAIAKADGRFGLLVDALDAAGLSATLRGAGPYTLFAPTDAAFRALPPELLTKLLADKATLAKVLTYHVLGGRLTTGTARTGDLATVEGDPVTITTTASGFTVDGATVLTHDLAATNGVVHALDRVLVPADVDLAKLGVPLTPPTPITLTVYFDPDSATLRADAAAAVADLAKRIPAGARVALVGVADQRGDAEANRQLSEDRARSVQRALEAAGLKATYTISARGAEPNGDLQQARRVEITAS
jgi:uncharacterized surface protein with fasciclin (FAS1) repeats